MGVVHLARDTALDRTLVLKFLSPSIASDEQARERFAREAKAASALDHPNICTVYDVGTTSAGSMYIAMAHYEGKTLSERIAEGSFTVDEVVDIALQVLSGLGRAHDAGIVHRDIKPANVILTNRGEVKLLDFGLAKTADVGLTRSGMMMGTLGYMAPEQIQGKEVDSRADLWSTGVMLYEMLSGQRPFRGEYDQAILYSIVNEEPARLEDISPEVPAPVCEVVHGLLQKDPDMRIESAQLVSGRLKNTGALPTAGDTVGPISKGRRKWFSVIGGLAVVGLILAALALWFGKSEGAAIQNLMAEGDYFRSLEGPQYTRMAIERFREVVRRDSTYAPGYAKLAEGYILLGDDESEPLARQALQTAMALDSTASEAHVSQGLVYELYDRDWSRAEAAFRRAITRDPTNEFAHYELGWLLLRTGHTQEGRDNLRRARSLNSSSVLTLYGAGISEYYTGQYDAAARTFLQAFRQERGHQFAFFFLVMSYLHGERFVEAAELVSGIPDPSSFYRSPGGAYYFAASGVRESAMQMMSELGRDISAWERAKVFAALEENDQAIEELEGVMDDPPIVMNALGIEPAFKPLHGDPRFREMMRRLGVLPGGE
jgi:tetratricopeptide (TPR) repeat protein